jgi:hypothetical protein
MCKLQTNSKSNVLDSLVKTKFVMIIWRWDESNLNVICEYLCWGERRLRADRCDIQWTSVDCIAEISFMFCLVLSIRLDILHLQCSTVELAITRIYWLANGICAIPGDQVIRYKLSQSIECQLHWSPSDVDQIADYRWCHYCCWYWFIFRCTELQSGIAHATTSMWMTWNHVYR